MSDNGNALAIDQVRPSHVEEFIADQLDKLSSSTAATRYRYLQQFFRWAEREDEIQSSPMVGLDPPAIDEKVVDILSDDELRLLLGSAEGKDFTDRRDAALMRLLIDSGLRASEIMGLTVEDVDLDDYAAIVTGKGRKQRLCPFGNRTGEALDRYLRVRARHKHAARPEFWLAIKGPLSTSGLTQMLRRRAAVVGIEKIHPHMFRHTWAHRWLANEGNEGDLQALAGWSSPQMVGRYGASAKAERARQNHKRLGLGDRL